MDRNQAKAFMKALSEQALHTKGQLVSKPVETPERLIDVRARANRIGFVYWYWDDKPMPRKMLQGMLERATTKEVS